MEKKSKLSILTNGIIKENPTLVLLLGTCPFLATSSSLINALGMGLNGTFGNSRTDLFQHRNFDAA